MKFCYITLQTSQKYNLFNVPLHTFSGKHAGKTVDILQVKRANETKNDMTVVSTSLINED
jgi:hypothetical protein